MTEETIFYVGMLNLTMGFHVISTREFLSADRTLMTLGSVDVGVMPTIRNDFITTDTTIERRQSAR